MAGSDLPDGAWTPAHGGLLEVRGPDAASFLHRLGTQDTAALAPGQAALNAFLDKRGRLQALAHHVAVDEATCWLVLRDQSAEKLAAFFDGFLFMEEVTLTAHEDLTMWLSVGGEEPASVVIKGEHRGRVRTLDVVDERRQTRPVWLHFGGPPPAASPDEAWFEAAEVAAGVPRAPTEINDAVGPLELFLGDVISWTKGCYIGQEVVSRIESKDRLPKQLLGLRGEATPSAGDVVTSDGQDVGRVTRVCRAPFPGAIHALALVKTSAVDGALLVGGQPVEVLPRPAAQALNPAR